MTLHKTGRTLAMGDVVSDQSPGPQGYVQEAASRATERDEPIFVAHMLEQLDGATLNQAINSRSAGEAIAVIEAAGWQLTNISAALSPDLKSLTLMTFRPSGGTKRSGRVVGMN